MPMTEEKIQEVIEGHQTRNAELLRLIESKGADLHKVFRPEHHFWAYSRDSATELANELYKRGYRIMALSPGEDESGAKYWNIEASIERTPAEAASTKTTEELVRLAAALDAEYDGWGLSV